MIDPLAGDAMTGLPLPRGQKPPPGSRVIRRDPRVRLWWPCWEGAGSGVRDLIRTTSGRLPNGAKWTSGMAGGAAIALDGAQSQYIASGSKLEDAGGLFAADDRQWSVQVWARLRRGARGTLASRAVTAPPHRTFQVYFGGGGRTPAVLLRGNEVRTDAQSDDDNWHLHTATWDGRIGRYFLDQQLVIEVPCGDAAENTEEYFKVGAGPTPGDYLSVDISDVRVWSHSLTTSEIGTVFSDPYVAFRGLGL